MDTFWFVVKGFVATIVVVMALQIEVGTTSIESHINRAARTTGVIDLAQTMADGTSKFIRTMWNGFVGGVNKTFKGEKIRSEFSFERSKDYLKRKTQSAKEAVLDETAYSKSATTYSADRSDQ